MPSGGGFKIEKKMAPEIILKKRIMSFKKKDVS